MPEKLDREILYQDALKQIKVLEEKLKRGAELRKIGMLESYAEELKDKVERIKKHASNLESKVKKQKIEIKKYQDRIQEITSGEWKSEQMATMKGRALNKNKEIARLKQRVTELVNQVVMKNNEIENLANRE